VPIFSYYDFALFTSVGRIRTIAVVRVFTTILSVEQHRAIACENSWDKRIDLLEGWLSEKIRDKTP